MKQRLTHTCTRYPYPSVGNVVRYHGCFHGMVPFKHPICQDDTYVPFDEIFFTEIMSFDHVYCGMIAVAVQVDFVHYFLPPIFVWV